MSSTTRCGRSSGCSRSRTLLSSPASNGLAVSRGDLGSDPRLHVTLLRNIERGRRYTTKASNLVKKFASRF